MIQIEVTTKCSGKCIYCYRYGVEDWVSKNMTLDTFQKIVDFIPWKNNEWLLQGAGEPLLNPNLCDMMQYVYDKDPNSIISTITNGDGLNKEIFDSLALHKMNKISLSIDGLEKQFEGYRRGIPWEKIQNACEIISEYNCNAKTPIDFGFSTVAMKSNLYQLMDILEFGIKYGINSMSINALNDVHGTLSHEVIDDVDKDIKKSIFTDLEQKGLNDGVRVYIPMIDNEKCKKRLENQKKCAFAVKSLYADVDGFVNPCCMVSSKKMWGHIEQPILTAITAFHKQWEEGTNPAFCQDCIDKGIVFIR